MEFAKSANKEVKMNLINNYSSTDEIEEIGCTFEEIKRYGEYLNREKANRKNFTVVFVNNRDIHDLNLEFRDKDRPTDVLTFVEESDVYLGDVIISVEKVLEQALEYGHDVRRETLFLVTHGFLHLLGYDHQTPEDELEMFDEQERLLTGYKVFR